jgi:hypothetical protein
MKMRLPPRSDSGAALIPDTSALLGPSRHKMGVLGRMGHSVLDMAEADGKGPMAPPAVDTGEVEGISSILGPR